MRGPGHGDPDGVRGKDRRPPRRRGRRRLELLRDGARAPARRRCWPRCPARPSPSWRREMEREYVPAGQGIVLEGERGDRFYVVLARDALGDAGFARRAARAAARATTSARSVRRWASRGRRRCERSRPRPSRAATGRRSTSSCCSPTTLDRVRHRQDAPASASTSSDSFGQALGVVGPVVEGRSPRKPSAMPGSGSTQRNVPLPPKWPNVRGELREPVQCGALPSRSSKPSPQSFGSMRPKSGARRRARGRRRRSPRERLRRDERRRRSSRASASEVVERPLERRAGEPRSSARSSERLEHRAAQVLLERHLSKTNGTK